VSSHSDTSSSCLNNYNNKTKTNRRKQFFIKFHLTAISVLKEIRLKKISSQSHLLCEVKTLLFKFLLLRAFKNLIFQTKRIKSLGRLRAIRKRGRAPNHVTTTTKRISY
jgi:hypothetical protein